ncbi:hypothetical protein [Paenibacillus hexagrammi]|uniref:Heat induced stress protein YflT n=1 Tax=Paenibacillus hexagrammi TaxID=2908839 RepID=A0ABY3SIC6_9BACL|nr:hypothetical protein [Paenibacillus sp. YPD9-1]UJF32875.1 hypothetical protein L0M14_25400 [Paenibacillus sp. YPD9-1]
MDSFVPIFFEFDQQRDAYLALDTLEELGYKPEFVQEADKPTLHIHVDEQDITSALEIAQAHGGRLMENVKTQREEATYAMAYDLENSIRIPAHTVNEDWPEGYATQNSAYASDEVPTDEEAAFDPSADDYNHFSAGIRF